MKRKVITTVRYSRIDVLDLSTPEAKKAWRLKVLDEAKKKSLDENYIVEGVTIAYDKEELPKNNINDIYYDMTLGKFKGITDEHIQGWREAYPGIDIINEINKCEQWYKVRPTKVSQRSRWAMCIVRWLGNAVRYREANRYTNTPKQDFERDQELEESQFYEDLTKEMKKPEGY